jgi:uncharacterized cupredoxin-like copper-binding protein
VATSQKDREATGTATMVFALVALLLAFAAFVTAAQAVSRSNSAKKRVAKIEDAGLLGHVVKVTLEEFTITPHPAYAQAGTVVFDVDNVGSITHEMVIVRAPSLAALPKVTKPGGERAVGAIDEEAIPESDTIGETGDVPARAHVTKSFTLTPGTYVLFCNIDTKNSDGSVINHFQHGMSATITII